MPECEADWPAQSATAAMRPARRGAGAALPRALVPIDNLEESPHVPIVYLEDTVSKLELLQGTLDLIVLKLLRAGPANGWDLTQSIQVVSKGALDVNYGSLYPALRRLEAKGWIKGRWGLSENNRRARFYELTTAGQKQLDSERQAWERFSNALGLILRAE